MSVRVAPASIVLLATCATGEPLANVSVGASSCAGAWYAPEAGDHGTDEDRV